MVSEMEAIRKVFGTDAAIESASAFEIGLYRVNDRFVTVDRIGETMYTDVFYRYFDYADVDGYRTSWEKEEYRA